MNRTPIEWVREIVEACDKAGIPVFLKDNLKSIIPLEEPFGKWKGLSYDNEYFELRQEMPGGR